MSAKALVEDIEHLVSLPDVCVKLNRLLDSADYCARHVGEILAQDTDLSARLLRLVNSAYFGLRAPVDTISRAVTVIGIKEVRNLVMAASVVKVFTGIPGDLVDMDAFWRHSLMSGVVARLLGAQCNVLHSERLFVMGMLHDIGRLVIYLTLPEQARDILLITGGDDWLLAQTEEDLMGFSHMDVGEELLRRWELPEGLVFVVGAHHRPERAGDYRFDASLVHLAIALCHGEMNGLSLDESLITVHPCVWELTGLHREDVADLYEEIPVRVGEAVNMILSPAGSTSSSTSFYPD